MVLASSAEKKLNDARYYLNKLGESIDHLEDYFPSIFSDSELKFRFESFRQEHKEALNRLNVPTLSIATLGTTSSGKSTIVNALIGRSIAPMEAGEMSAGVLLLQHSLDEHKVVVEATKDATWATGDLQGSGDDKILYEHISNVMDEYRKVKKECMAPQVKVLCSLLPASNRDLLGLPEGVRVEFIDLPGLKSVQDRANLEVIQKQVPKAFSIVALDYSQVDDEHRKTLLGELKTVVEYLQGQTDSMLFILNRVDRRTINDIPLDERINKLREEIQQVLSLEQLPEVLPFCSLLLYYAQCAWGSVAPNNSSPVSQAVRLNFLAAMRQDCSNVIIKNTDKNQQSRDLWRKIEDLILNEQDINDETMRAMLDYALDWSGGKELWSRLYARVQESFSELVILPALTSVFTSYNALVAAINTLADVRKLESEAQVEVEQRRINEARQQLDQIIKNLCEEFSNETTETISLLKKGKVSDLSDLATRALERGRKGFQSLFDAVDIVNKDLTSKLIIPVSDALGSKSPVYQLKEKLREVTTSVLAEEIAEAYEKVKDELAKFESSADKALIRRVPEGDNKGKKELKMAEFAVRKLYFDMREALSKRAEFMLQGHAQEILAALQGLVDEQKDELYRKCRELLPSLKLDEAIMAVSMHGESQSLPTLPEKFFELPAAIEERTKNEEVIGEKKQVTESYTSGTCFKTQKTRTVFRDTKKNIEYKELSLPSPKMMALEWANGIEQGKQNLWDVIRDWFVKHLASVSEDFNKSVSSVMDLAERELEQQKIIIQQSLEEELKRWEEIKLQTSSIAKIYEELKKISLTSQEKIKI